MRRQPGRSAERGGASQPPLPGQPAFDEIEPVLPPEDLAVDDVARCAEHPRVDRALGVGLVALLRRLRVRVFEPAPLFAAAETDKIKAAYQAGTDKAIAAQVFGAPSYVLDGEIFWGQDRLDFLDRALSRRD